MFSFLLAGETNPGTGTGTWILLAVVAVMLIGMYLFSSFSKRKYRAQAQERIRALKVGDKVVTSAGVFGEITEITETTFGRLFVLKTGNEKNFSYIKVSSDTIYGLDTSEPIILDENGNPINLDEPKDVEEAKKEVLKDVNNKKVDDAKKEATPNASQPTTKQTKAAKETSKNVEKK